MAEASINKLDKTNFLEWLEQIENLLAAKDVIDLIDKEYDDESKDNLSQKDESKDDQSQNDEQDKKGKGNKLSDDVKRQGIAKFYVFGSLNHDDQKFVRGSKTVKEMIGKLKVIYQ